MQELTSIQFVEKFIRCIKEYRKKLGETRSDHDTAHFFDPILKKFILDHEKEFKLLSTINCDRSFLSFCEMWFFKKGK